MIVTTKPASQRDVLCGCQQLVARYWPDGLIVPVGAQVTCDDDGLFIQCPRCDQRTRIDRGGR